jgi:hypothetical protein
MNYEQLDMFPESGESSQAIHFLEDVKDFEKKVILHELATKAITMAQHGDLVRYDEQSAQLLADDLNSRYGRDTARVSQSKDARGVVAFRVHITIPYRSEFKDILDENGEILPSRNQKHAA